MSEEMDGSKTNLYKFGHFILDPARKVLTKDGEVIRLAPKPFEILFCLVRNAQQIVSKEELIREVWPDSFVEDANLTVQISALRKILNGEIRGSTAIETFPKVGYRFNAEVELVGEVGVMPTATDALQPRRSRTWVGVLTLAVVATVGFIGGSYVLSRHAPTPVIIRVPGTENAASIALSPNGEYLAHADSILGKRALMMTNIASGSSVQLIGPDETTYWGMKFSRDNSYLYFVRVQDESLVLNRIPILGGTSSTVLRDVGQGLSFSPDGSQLCFVRRGPGPSSAIIVAASDGSNERELARRMAPKSYSTFDIAWSPDGKTIAAGANDASADNKLRFVGVNVDSGQETALSDEAWSAADGVAWLPDGTALVAGVQDGDSSPTQVWLIPVGTGEPHRLTNDLDNYGSIDVSADGRTILAGQFKDETALWIQPGGDSSEAHRITNEKHHNFNWVRWSGNDRLIFGSSQGSNRDVWEIEVDGSNEKQITSNAGSNIMPVTTSDGATVVFCSNRQKNGGFDLFRANPDGTNVIQLTNGSGENQPAISPDNKWIYYTSGAIDGDKQSRTVWKVAIDGGDPIQFAKQPSFAPAVSPDSNFVALWLKVDDDTSWRVGILRASDGSVVKLLDIPFSNSIKWTTDGRGISYMKAIDGVTNIWTQPISGGAAIQETKYTSGQIANFDRSPANVLVSSRTERTRDVLLIRNFR